MPTAEEHPRIQALKENSGWSIAIGIILIILGISALGSPLYTGVAIAIMVGSFLLVGGIVQFVFAFRANSWGAGLLNFFGGALSFVCGLLVIAHPLYGLKFLTLLSAYCLSIPRSPLSVVCCLFTLLAQSSVLVTQY